MKWLASTKIAVGFAVIAASAYFGWNVVTDRMILHEKFAPIAPGRVNIVGIDPGAGFRIIVSNQTAQLAETAGGFGAGGSSAGDSGDSADDGGSIKQKIPLRDLLRVLQGDDRAVGPFVMSLNGIKDDALPPERIMWKAEDMRKALDGDSKLQEKLVNDLNVRLDGTPLDVFRLRALSDGIVVDAPVTVSAQVGNDRRHIVGRVLLPYMPILMKTVMSELTKSGKFWDANMAAGTYGRIAVRLRTDEKLREDVRKSLEALISKPFLQKLASYPEKVLGNAQVIVNDSLIESAQADSYVSQRGDRMSNIDIALSDEGRRRLWQYSKLQPNAQILVISDGIAIAAPRIRHELAQSNLTITQVPDETLVAEAVKIINESKKKGFKNE